MSHERARELAEAVVGRPTSEIAAALRAAAREGEVAARHHAPCQCGQCMRERQMQALRAPQEGKRGQ